MLCALSGTTPKEPVVSPRSGAVFEKKLIESYVSTAGKDPINDQPLTVEELITLAETPAIVPPKPPSFNSIPTMLSAFQNEWDALALEVFTLRKQLHTARQELSLALYRYDAAVRVAARATSERDEAQNALAQLSESFAAGNGAAPENGDSEVTESESTNNIPVDLLSQARDELFALHKQKKVTLPVAKDTEVEVSSESTSLDIVTLHYNVDAESQKYIVSGSENTVLVSEKTQKFPKYDAVCFLNDDGKALAVGANDKVLHYLEEDRKIAINIPGLEKIAAHPSKPLFAVTSGESQWVLADQSGPLYTASVDGLISAIDFHVDGMLLGVASSEDTKAKIDIYDLSTTQVVSTIPLGENYNVVGIKFAYNGYWLVVGSTSSPGVGKVEIFDLRKSTLVQSFETEGGHFALDPSCQVLVTGSSKLQVHLYNKKAKAWKEAVAEIESEDSVRQLAIDSTADSVQKTKKVKVSALLKESISHHEFTLK